jgi:hypothetical protein
MIKDNEYTLSKLVLESGAYIGTYVGNNLADQSKKNFIAKMSKASQKVRETEY